jgi:hypothetical protein
VHWSKCARNDLSDGSKIDTASASNGAGTVTVAIREFPDDRGGVAIMAWNYPEFSPTKSGQNMNFGGPPDPSTVIKPSPFTEQQLADALADPSIKLGLTSDAKTGPARGFLQAADLGPGWTFDPVQSRNATGGLQMDNGCAPNKSMFGSGMPAGRTAYFQGRLPSGAAAAVDEAEYPLPKGTGASTMALAKAQAQGGCDPAPGVEFSKDAVAALPSGIGDDAFVQDDHGDGQVRIVIRFGDTIVETFVTEPPTAATPKVPDLSSPVDKTWLTSVARQIAVRWTAQ